MRSGKVDEEMRSFEFRVPSFEPRGAAGSMKLEAGSWASEPKESEH